MAGFFSTRICSIMQIMLPYADFFPSTISLIIFFSLFCCSYFIKLLIEKKYALPYRVLDAMVAHFMNFFDETRVMPVIWHLSLLVFVQRLVSPLRFLWCFFLFMVALC